MIKTFTCFITVVILTFSFSMNTYAAQRRSNVDISDGKVVSSKSDFYFDVPISWNNYIEVFRSTDSSKIYMEKFDFYYLPRDDGNYRSFLMSLYVYDINNWKLEKNHVILLKNDKYVISTLRAENNYYYTPTDKIVYDRFLSEIWTYQFLSSRIVGIGIPESDNYTISVNGSRIKDKAIEVNGVVYLPLRSVCNPLDYSISWNGATSSVIVDNRVSIGNLSTNSGDFGSRIINNKTYAPVIFYVNKLKLNIDIDVNNNVKISN